MLIKKYSLSVDIGKKKDILVLVQSPAKGYGNTITAEAKNPINFTKPRRSFLLKSAL